MFGNYFSGKRVLVTGHTGFKGSWLSMWLKELGAEVTGLALPPETSPNLHQIIGPGTYASEFITDIRDAQALERDLHTAAPDFIFHLAAQAIVRRSYANPVETMQTNVLGTVNLLEAVRKLGRPVPVLVVTTDKCYENRGCDTGYREEDPLGGHDIYSASKAACEITVAAWRRSFFQPDEKLGNVATARAGNVIGGGDYSMDRIVPDCMRALASGESIRVRNPHATRPWQHVLDCLSGYLWLGAKLAASPKNSHLADAFNFGPSLQSNRDVRALVEELLRHWLGRWQDASDPNAPHEAGRLHLSIHKAATCLDWQPTWEFEEAVHHTAAWYRQRHEAGDDVMAEFSRSQIELYASEAARKGRAWAREEASDE